MFDNFALESDSDFYGGILEPDRWTQLVLWPFFEIQQVTVLLPQYESQRFAAAQGPCPLDIQASGGRNVDHYVVRFIRPAFAVNQSFIDLVLNVSSTFIGDGCPLLPLQLRLWAPNATSSVTTVSAPNAPAVDASILLISDTLVEITWSSCHAQSASMTVLGPRGQPCWTWSSAFTFTENLATGQVEPQPPTSTVADLRVTTAVASSVDIVENRDILTLANAGFALSNTLVNIQQASDNALQNLLGLPPAWFTTNATLNFTVPTGASQNGSYFYLPVPGVPPTGPGGSITNATLAALEQLDQVVNASLVAGWSSTSNLQALYQQVNAQVEADERAALSQQANASTVSVGMRLQAQLDAAQAQSQQVLNLALRAAASAHDILKTFDRTSAGKEGRARRGGLRPPLPTPPVLILDIHVCLCACSVCHERV